jgi:hypothetical protein
MAGNETTIKPTAEYEMYLENCVWKKIEFPVVIRFPSRLFYASHFVCLIYNIIQTFLIITLNYLAIHAFYKSSQLRRKTTLFLVMILSANDFLVGLISEPMFLLCLSREMFGNKNCLIEMLNFVTSDTLLGISAMTFLVLNFEIYLSIIYPIFHKTKITNRRVLYLLLCLWFAAMTRSYLFGFYLDRNTVEVIITLLISSALLAMVFMHSRIFITVYKRRRIEPAASSNIQRGKAFLRGVRDAKSCLLVLCCTVCCFLPSSIENGMRTKTMFKEIVLDPWAATFILSASVLNSVVFYWRNKILRKEAMRILRTLYWKYLKRRSDYIME